MRKRLQLQLVLILFAAVLVAALSVFLISDAVRNAETTVIADAEMTLAVALSELDAQYQDRSNMDSAWTTLPAAARDTSLRGVSAAVLRSFPGVEGGYYDGAHFLGYSYPTHDVSGKKTDVPTAELDDIFATIEQSGVSSPARRVLREPHDIVVIQAKTAGGIQPGGNPPFVSWAMKRLPGQNEPGARRREILMSVLVVAALISVAGTLGIGFALQRAIVQIKSGLSTLESDFNYRLAERKDELGEISRSVNRMAAVRQKLEMDLRREDRLRTTGRLVAAIAHEIRNPLNSIRLSIQYLEMRLKSGGVRSDDMRPVVEEVDRLDSLLADLLAFHKAKPPDLRDQPVAPVVQRCLNLLQAQAAAHKAEIHTDLGRAGIEGHFDAEQLTQILMNLLLNAIEACGSSGAIGVKLEQRGEIISVQVHDSGPGLTDEQVEHLFEAFYTTKAGGTGLGLAVSRELAIGMGGALHYRNGSPGATFAVELPAATYAKRDGTRS